MTFANSIGATGLDRGYSISVDSSGNSYVTGFFRETVDFDPGAGTTNLTSAGGSDTFIAKYNSDGTLAWAKNVGGTGHDFAYSIEVDSSGNSYVTGAFNGTADFDPGAGTTNLTSAGSSDVFIAKYNSDGTLAWAKNVGGTISDYGQSIAIDSSGNSYVTGYFYGTADFDPGAGTTNLTSAGTSDTFIAKYNSDGTLDWAKNVGGTNGDQGQSIQVDSSGNSYITGNFQGTADFDPGAGTTNLTSAGNDDAFIAKYNSDGTLAWAKNSGGTDFDIGYSIEVDSSGNSYVTGYFQGTVDFDPGAGTTNLTSAGVKDVFIAKYNSDGTLDWAKNVGGTSDDVSYSISVDSSGNSYVTGIFQGTADFDPGAGTTNLTSAGNDDAFIAKYDSDGALVWAKNVGGTSDDYGQSIEVDSSGNSYVTGYFSGTADFDPGAGTENLTSAGSSDVFLLKLDSDGNLVSAVAQTPGGGSSGGSSSGGGLTVTDQTSEDVTGTATGRTLVNNTGGTATGELVQNTGNGNVVTATLPSGVSLTNSGTSTAVPGSTAGTTLTGEIRANEEEVSQQSFLDGHGQTFITNSGDMALDIRSISFASTGTTAETVKITGDDGAANGSEAFVINTSGLPASSNIVLDNIEFAAIVGQAFVTGGAGQNYVVGDDAVQFISLGAGDDTLAGGGGNDSIGSGVGEDIIYGNQGDDLVFGGEGKDTLYGGQNNDTAVGGSGDDVLHGNKGNDILYGNQSNDTLSGGENDDILFGGQGNDLLSGGSGDDFLAGNKGDDILVGGDGADTFAFYYSGGNDQISDFTVGTDTLMLEDGLGVSDGTETDGNTTITFSDGGTLTVMGVSKTEITSATGWELG